MNAGSTYVAIVVLAPMCRPPVAEPTPRATTASVAALHCAHHLARVEEERLARTREADPLRGALDQFEPAAALEIAHGARNGRLAYAE